MYMTIIYYALNILASLMHVSFSHASPQNLYSQFCGSGLCIILPQTQSPLYHSSLELSRLLHLVCLSISRTVHHKELGGEGRWRGEEGGWWGGGEGGEEGEGQKEEGGGEGVGKGPRNRKPGQVWGQSTGRGRGMGGRGKDS